jgi:hypothetical protein
MKQRFEIEKNLGITLFWRSLLCRGRWGCARPELDDINRGALHDIAEQHFLNAYGIAKQGKFGVSDSEVSSVLHYLQEMYYCVGNYASALPYIDELSKLNLSDQMYYRFALIVSQENVVAEKISEGLFSEADTLLDEVEANANVYFGNQPNDTCIRLAALRKNVKQQSRLKECDYIEEFNSLPPLETAERNGVWEKIRIDTEFVGCNSNNWLIDTSSPRLFMHTKDQRLVEWNIEESTIREVRVPPMPDDARRIVWAPNENTFYSWASYEGNVYSTTVNSEGWVECYKGKYTGAFGGAYGWNSLKQRPFQFGGYGHFKKKNWWHEFDVEKKSWQRSIKNMPGASPCPRNTQLVQLGEQTIGMFSGTGNDTGLQREHVARHGYPAATDVGYWTWLRDFWIINLKTMKWEQALTGNHHSIRHEGRVAYNPISGVLVNWGGAAPAVKYGDSVSRTDYLSSWNLKDPTGFKNVAISGDIPACDEPVLAFVPEPCTENYLLSLTSGYWRLRLV